jgi:hypothetical protein
MAMVRWVAGLGAVTAEGLAVHLGISLLAGRAWLAQAVEEGLLARQRPLANMPALYTTTSTGRRLAGVRGLDPCRPSAAAARHLSECTGVAVALERRYPRHRVQGERELRLRERERGCALASAELGRGPHGEALMHRPDLVLWPNEPRGGLPLAVEVELTVKAPKRLAGICRAWARARCVAGVLYVVAPEAEAAVSHAVERAQAQRRILVAALGAVCLDAPAPRSRSLKATGPEPAWIAAMRAGERGLPL